MPVIIALVNDRAGRSRIVEALRGHADVRFCERGDAMRVMASEVGVVAVITEVRDREGMPLAPTIHALRSGFPSVPILAYCRPTQPTASTDILTAAQAGVNGLILGGIDDVGTAFQTALSMASDSSLAKQVMAELQNCVSPGGTQIIRYCMENARYSLSVDAVARTFGVHRKTLHNRLAAEGFPKPSALIAWCRLILAARLMEDSGRTVEQIAHSLDFASGGALRNMLKRYTRLRPHEVRQWGGALCVVRAFKRQLRPRPARLVADRPILRSPRPGNGSGDEAMIADAR